MISGQVLVRVTLDVQIVIQVADHHRIMHDAIQQSAEVACGVFTEELVLVIQRVTVLDNALLCGEVSVPKQSQLLLQRARRLDHALEPPLPQPAELPTVHRLSGTGGLTANKIVAKLALQRIS